MTVRTTLRTDLNVFANFNPKLPESYRQAPYLILGNIQPALQRSVRNPMNGLRLTRGDTMNYWIKDYRAELLETIRDWDFLLINDAEARMLSGEYNLKRAAAKIFEMGPHTLVIKRGEHGAILFHRGNTTVAPKKNYPGGGLTGIPRASEHSRNRFASQLNGNPASSAFSSMPRRPSYCPTTAHAP